MTPDEKKERIDYLWDKVRKVVLANKFLKLTQKSVKDKYIDHFANQEKFDVENTVKSSTNKF